MNQYLSRLYSTETYSENTGGWLPNEDAAKAATIMRVLRKAGVKDSVRTVLDVGCGIGGILRRVHAALPSGATALGIDLSSIAIGIANQEPAAGLEFRAEPLDQVHGRYDLVILSHVLEHVPAWDGFLEELAAKTGRYLYINVPLEVNALSALRGRSLLETYRKYGHVHFFDESFVVSYLEDCGFRVLVKDYGEEFLAQTSTFRGQVARLPRWLLGRLSRRLATRLLGGYSLALLCAPPAIAAK